jgi:stress response protein SCP2
MSMNSYVIGFKPPDDKWKQMKKAFDACCAAGIKVPDEVMEYFHWESPDDSGVKIDGDKLSGVKKHSADMEDGFEVDIRKLPPDVTIIRFVNSY